MEKSRNRQGRKNLVNIAENIRIYLEGDGRYEGRIPTGRYASFDYCFNYFQSFKERNAVKDMSSPEYMQSSCFWLAFYLASWGMLRAKSFLLEKSAKFYEPVIQTISQIDKSIWEIDVDKYYDDKNISLLLDCKEKIATSLGEENNPSDTLITKIMLGVFGNVPAYDRYFRKGFKVHSFNKKSLEQVAKFYQDNQKEIDSYKIKTFDFLSGKETNRYYTKAKLIDMIGFIEGR